MFAANNGSWFQQGLNYLKNHPVFISVNEILAAQITVQWLTKTVCANLLPDFQLVGTFLEQQRRSSSATN